MKKNNHFLIFLLLLVSSANAQVNGSEQPTHYRNDTDLLSKEFHAKRRMAVREELPDNSVAVFFSNPIRNRANDVDYEYHQDPNFYYLSGHTEPNSMLLIFKDKQQIQNKSCTEILFLQERNAEEELWTGRILGTKEAPSTLGIETIFKNSDFQHIQINFEKFDKIVVAQLKAVDQNTKDSGDLFQLQNRYTTLLTGTAAQKQDADKLDEIMCKLREIKQAEELSILRKAITISCRAHIELIKSLHTGMAEYQAQSILEYGFKNEGAEFEGYPSIVGNGENSCVLHYTENRKQLNGEQLLLCDAGAEYHGYTADITRTIPVDGVYSPEEKAVYELVLRAQEAGIKACLAGNKFYAPHLAAVKIIQQGLLSLGIIKEASDYRKYFMHGTSHYLGLDVHDAGLYGNLKAGNIITVEPGIYIPEGSACDKKWWNIGVRIEDDILITTSDPENLSASIPRKADEIEALMKQKGFFEK